jgi:hypothetical protein
MNEFKPSGESLFRRPHAQPVLAPEFTVCLLPAATHHEKGADAERLPGSYRDLC